MNGCIIDHFTHYLKKKKKKSMLDPIGTDQSFIEMATGHLLTLNFSYVKPQYKL